MTQDMVSILEERDSYEYQVTFCHRRKRLALSFTGNQKNGISIPSQGNADTSSLLIVKT